MCSAPISLMWFVISLQSWPEITKCFDFNCDWFLFSLFSISVCFLFLFYSTSSSSSFSIYSLLIILTSTCLGLYVCTFPSISFTLQSISIRRMKSTEEIEKKEEEEEEATTVVVSVFQGISIGIYITKWFEEWMVKSFSRVENHKIVVLWLCPLYVCW